MPQPSRRPDDRDTRATARGSAGVVRPDDLEFEIEFDMESDDDLIVEVGSGRRAEDSETPPTAPVETPAPARAEPTPGRPLGSPPPPPVPRAPGTLPPQGSGSPTRRATEESGSRYAIATRGGESTVVAPRRPVVVPRNR